MLITHQTKLILRGYILLKETFKMFIFLFTVLRIYPEIFVNMDNYMHDTTDEDDSDNEVTTPDKGIV